MTFVASMAVSLWASFANPPDSAKPWCYWWWINGHADRETITADLESMKRLGFGGVLMFDSRGYWENDEHVVNPKAEICWGSDEWYDLVEGVPEIDASRSMVVGSSAVRLRAPHRGPWSFAL